MRTRVFLIIGIVGLAVWWYGSTQNEKMIPIFGIILTIIGFLGAYISASNKKGIKFFRWL